MINKRFLSLFLTATILATPVMNLAITAKDYMDYLSKPRTIDGPAGLLGMLDYYLTVNTAKKAMLPIFVLLAVAAGYYFYKNKAFGQQIEKESQDCFKLENGTLLKLILGDITKQPVDAIVNAANEDLDHGGGVAQAICNAAGGNTFQNMCNKMPYVTKEQFQEQRPGLPFRDENERCPMGYAVVMDSGNLKKNRIKHVIHTTGPRGIHNKNPTEYALLDLKLHDSSGWKEIKCDAAEYRENLLKSCYTSSLKVADEKGCTSIAFPSISTAIFGYPIKDAAPVALAAVKTYFDKNCDSSVKEVRFVSFSNEDFGVYRDSFAQLKSDSNRLLMH